MNALLSAVCIVSLFANAVLLFAFAAAYRRAGENNSRAHWYESQCRELARQLQGSVRRDPRTGRYLKKGR